MVLEAAPQALRRNRSPSPLRQGAGVSSGSRPGSRLEGSMGESSRAVAARNDDPRRMDRGP